MRPSAKTIMNLDIQVPNQTRYLRLVGSVAELVAREIEVTADDREALAYHLNLVVTEAVTNAIQYGGSNEEAVNIRLLILYKNNDLCVRVYDHGAGFDLDSVPAPGDMELSEALIERGRGIFLIRSLMDSVTYRRTQCGNILEMKKRVG